MGEGGKDDEETLIAVNREDEVGRFLAMFGNRFFDVAVQHGTDELKTR